MRLVNATLFVLGAALSLDAASATAQGTGKATSTKRIPVTKEAPGEVVAPRVDTVTIYRTDTLRMRGRVDTVTRTVTRYDTVRVVETVAAAPVIMKGTGGWYLGVAGGASMPAANWNDASHTGWRIEVPFGIDPVGSPLGLRFNLGYGSYEPHSYLSNTVGNASLMNADADLKLRIGGFSPFSHRFEFYGVGGGSYNRFKDIVEINPVTNVYSIGEADGAPGAVPTNPDHSWESAWGYNVGGGVQFGWGAANLFAETRYSRFKHRSNLAHVPVMIGFSLY